MPIGFKLQIATEVVGSGRGWWGQGGAGGAEVLTYVCGENK